jgi:hypothetical protein
MLFLTVKRQDFVHFINCAKYCLGNSGTRSETELDMELELDTEQKPQ